MKRFVRLCCLTFILAPSLVFAAATHKVKKKDTLPALARKYHVSVADLKAANNIVNNRLKPGDVLVIPPRRTAAADEKSAARGGDATYKVKRGDTLLRVARITGVSVNELRRLNNLKSKRIKPGTLLVLRRDHVDEARPKTAHLRPIIHNELFNDGEYERTLQELASFDPEHSVDLSKNLQLNPKNEKVSLLKQKAFSFLGTRYRFGGSSRSGIDCSSFVQQVFRGMNVDLPRTAREQYSVGNVVPASQLQKGDLLFFQTYARYPSHVGIYLGDNKMIHASSRDRRVVISTINTPYYLSRFLGAKRIGKINPDIFNFSDLFVGVEEEREEDVLSNDTLGLTTGTSAQEASAAQ